MGPYIFHDPLWLLALLILPAVMWLRKRRPVPVWVVPFASTWYRRSLSAHSRWPEILGIAGLVLVILALARPQRVDDKREVHSQGYDLILAIDLSGSMLAEDSEKNGEPISRIDAIKPVVQAFIDERRNDRIGVVVFSGHAYTLAPLTFDHDWLARQTDRLSVGLIEDGTAIGDALGVALSRLEQTAHEEGGRRKGAFIILLTDGVNNCGTLAPLQAAEIAKSRGIPIYTIGAGKDGWTRIPVMDNGHKLGYKSDFSDLDEGALHDIADLTGGHFYRAYDSHTTTAAFEAINCTQKIEFQARTYLLTSELFAWFALPGAVLLALAALTSRTFKKSQNATPAARTAPAPALSKP